MLVTCISRIEDPSASELWDRISKEIPWRIHEATPEDLACLWKSSDLLTPPTPLHLEKWSSVKASSMAPRQLANIALSTAKRGNRALLADSNLFRSAILSNLPDFDDLDLGQICFAYGKVKLSDEPVLTAISERLVTLNFSVKMETVTAAVYCFCRCSFQSPELLRRLWRQASTLGVASCTDNQLLMLLSDPRSLEAEAARQEALGRLRRFKPSAIVRLLRHYCELIAVNPACDEYFLTRLIPHLHCTKDVAAELAGLSFLLNSRNLVKSKTLAKQLVRINAEARSLS